MHKTFTNGKADRELTSRLYAESFAGAFAQARELSYPSCLWGDAEASMLAAVFESGVFCNGDLKTIFLRDNAIGDGGACALARALENQVSMRARLQRVNLEGNPIGREGRAALERALLGSSCLLIC